MTWLIPSLPKSAEICRAKDPKSSSFFPFFLVRSVRYIMYGFEWLKILNKRSFMPKSAHQDTPTLRDSQHFQVVVEDLEKKWGIIHTHCSKSAIDSSAML